jgi:hypothetical protein
LFWILDDANSFDAWIQLEARSEWLIKSRDPAFEKAGKSCGQKAVGGYVAFRNPR